MERRRFLQLIGLAPVAAVAAPKVSYSFLGGIFRKKPTLEPIQLLPTMSLYIPGHLVYAQDWRYAVRIANIDVSKLVSEPCHPDLLDLLKSLTNPPLICERT